MSYQYGGYRRFFARYWTLGLVLLPYYVAAQTSPPTSVSYVITARAGSGKTQSADTGAAETAAPAVDVRTQPLFGERAKTSAQIDFEIKFLNDCDQQFENRPVASRFFATRGWEYVAESQLDTATYRFNLAHLLDDKNVDAYWGLGVVCYQKGHLADAVKMLSRGLMLADSNAVLMTDLATVQLKSFEQTRDSTDLDAAEQHLLRAVTLQPNYATAHLKTSYLYYLRADYGRAWQYLHQARHIDLSSIELVYLNDLMQKQPDPQRFFR